MTVVFDPVWSWPTIIIVVALLIAGVISLYRPRLAKLSKGPRLTLLALRLAVVAVLVWLMIRPALQQTEVEKQQMVIFALGDASRSMTTKDGPGGISRRDALVRTWEESGPLLESLAEDVEVRYYDFAEKLEPQEKPASEAAGRQTAIGAALEEVLTQAERQRTYGIFVFSDGAQRAVEPFDVDPRWVAHQLAEQQIPVFCVGFGTNALSGTSVDLAVEELLVDPIAYHKKLVPVSAKIRAVGAKGERIAVRLLVEDRTGISIGKSGEMKVPPVTSNAVVMRQIEVKQQQETIPVELSFVPEQTGEIKLAIEVIPLADELKKRNNRQETVISVQKGGLKVAYFDNFRPEQKFFRLLSSEEKLQLDFQLMRMGRSRSANRIDPAWFERGAYDVYVIGDVSAAEFGPELLAKLALRLEEGCGLLLTGGYRTFGAGGYANTPLAEWLPIEMDPAAQHLDTTLDPTVHHLKPLSMLPTRRGLQHYVMRIAGPAENLPAWETLPKLAGANRLTPKAGLVEVLAESPDGDPLLLAQEVGQSRVMVFAGDTTYQWVLSGHRDEHQRFWRQVIFWLARKEYDTEAPIWVRVEPRNHLPEASVDFQFGARDETGKPLTDAQFEVTVTGPQGKETSITPQSQGEESWGEFRETTQPGDYWIRVGAVHQGERVGFDAYSRFLVDYHDLELDHPAADWTLLEELAALTGGMTIPPEQFGDFLQKRIDSDSFKTQMVSVKRIRLWDNWWVLSAFVGLLSVEWIIRKKRGLV